jgi:hypothetical protein
MLLLDKTGNAISNTMYSITQYAYSDATLIDKYTFQIVEPETPPEEYVTPTFDEGDEILLKIDGFTQKNVITQCNVDDGIYKCNKIISLATVTQLKVKQNYVTFNTTALVDEEYYFNESNEVFYCSKRHASVFIPYSILCLRNSNLTTLLKENETQSYNDEADNSIYGDLSYLGDPFKIVDVGQYRELKIKKILSLIETAKYRDSNNRQYNTEYSEYLKSVTNIVKIDETTNSIEVKQSIHGNFDISFGC